MIMHDLRDLVMVYYSDSNGNTDYTWDKAKIKVWNPLEQKEMDLVFTGSSRGETPEEFIVHFNANYKDGSTCVDAFENTLRKIFPNIEEVTLNEYKKLFINELTNMKKLNKIYNIKK